MFSYTVLLLSFEFLAYRTCQTCHNVSKQIMDVRLDFPGFALIFRDGILPFFSSPVFAEKTRCCCAKSLIFCNISDIYFKLGLFVHYWKSNSHYQGRQFKMHLFRIIPFFWLRLFILYQATHCQALAPACGALVYPSFNPSFNLRPFNVPLQWKPIEEIQKK